MNKKAGSIGMDETYFEDPSGVSAENISSARDVLKLLQYIYHKRSFLFDISKGKDFDTGSALHGATLANYNEFAPDARLIGMKNGQTTAARQTLASVWMLGASGVKSPVAIIVIGSEDRETDTQKLLAWLEGNL